MFKLGLAHRDEAQEDRQRHSDDRPSPDPQRLDQRLIFRTGRGEVGVSCQTARSIPAARGSSNPGLEVIVLHSPPEEALQGLARVGWLSEQPAEFQARIAAAGRWTTYARNAVLYAHGDDATALFGLGEGMLDVSIPVSRDEEIVIYRASPGFWIGDSAILAGATRSLSLHAAVKSRVFRLSAAAVLHILEAQPSAWACFARLAHRNGTLAIQILAEVLALPPRVRFARILLRLASADGMVRATQEDLGRMAGMSRAAFRRAFGELIATGVVATSYGGVRIVDRGSLEAVASGA